MFDKSESIGVRVAFGTKAKIDAIAKEQGKTQSDVVREAILQYLGETPPESVRSLVNDVRALQQKTDRLAKAMFR